MGHCVAGWPPFCFLQGLMPWMPLHQAERQECSFSQHGDSVMGKCFTSCISTSEGKTAGNAFQHTCCCWILDGHSWKGPGFVLESELLGPHVPSWNTDLDPGIMLARNLSNSSLTPVSFFWNVVLDSTLALFTMQCQLLTWLWPHNFAAMACVGQRESKQEYEIGFPELILIEMLDKAEIKKKAPYFSHASRTAGACLSHACHTFPLSPTLLY